MTRPLHRLILPALALTASAGLMTGCSTGASGADPAAASTGTSAGPSAEPAVLTLQDGWAKATDTSMTGVFGTLTNPTAQDLHLAAVECDLAATAELHVTVDDGSGGRVMQQAPDGFVIAAGGTHVLQPGGDHLMLIGLDEPVLTGQDVDLTLVDGDGGRYVVTVTARAFSGAEEHYVPQDEATTGMP